MNNKNLINLINLYGGNNDTKIHNLNSMIESEEESTSDYTISLLDAFNSSSEIEGGKGASKAAKKLAKKASKKAKKLAKKVASEVAEEVLTSAIDSDELVSKAVGNITDIKSKVLKGITDSDELISNVAKKAGKKASKKAKKIASQVTEEVLTGITDSDELVSKAVVNITENKVTENINLSNISQLHQQPEIVKKHKSKKNKKQSNLMNVETDSSSLSGSEVESSTKNPSLLVSKPVTLVPKLSSSILIQKSFPKSLAKLSQISELSVPKPKVTLSATLTPSTHLFPQVPIATPSQPPVPTPQFISQSLNEQYVYTMVPMMVPKSLVPIAQQGGYINNKLNEINNKIKLLENKLF